MSAVILPSFHHGFGFTSQVSSPVPSEKQAPLGAAWDVVVFRPETQPGVVSREEAGSLHSGHPEQSNQKRERRPFSKNARAPPWASAPAEEWTTADQEVRSVRLPIGSQVNLFALASLLEHSASDFPAFASLKFVYFLQETSPPCSFSRGDWTFF